MNEAEEPSKSNDSKPTATPLDSRVLDPDATRDSPAGFADASRKAPSSIGPYKLIRRLGEGGMGSVWFAEQTAPVKREVAIKLIKSGRFSEDGLKRFDLERQSLAIMNHPAIAKVFDAGSTADGQPYYVLEYVSGLPITKYCNQHRLGLRERIELIITVCEGIQHAHQKAIIHRDLKPSNILIAEIDGKPVPRIIDFGIAKAAQAADRNEDETIDVLTRAGGTLGTPGYMSPEQADPSILDVDTRTDVYSLGVVVYELLTASLPFDAKQWKTKRWHEVLRQLQEEDPPSPSTRISRTSLAAAQDRGLDPQKWVRQLRGDLDWITLKALERQRDRRYSSPADLAADLRRYLLGEPVTARPPSAAYRLRKFVGRNRLAVAFTAVLLILIVGFAISMTVERNRARREAETSKRVSDFMANMFKISDPSESRGSSITAREILDKSSEQIEKELGQDPQVQASLMQTMGATYRGLGLYDQARTLLEHAVAIQERTLGAENPETLRSMSLLGVVLEGLGRREDSERVLREALSKQQKVLGAEAPETMETVGYLSDTLNMEGHLAEAEGLIRRTLANQQRTLGPENPATLRSMRSLCRNLHDQGLLTAAGKLDRETIALEEHALGPDHPGTLWTMNQLALVLQEQGRYAEAEKLFRETLAVSTRVLGPDHDNTRAALANVGLVLQQEGHFYEAEAIQRQELAATRSAEGLENPDTLDSMNELGITLGKEHKLEESDKLLRASLGTAMRTLGPTAAITRNAMASLASTLAYEKREKESTALFEKLMEYAANSEGTAQGDANYQYAVGLAVLGHKQQALDHLQKAVESGFTNASELTSDEDLRPLRDDPRFQALANEIRRSQATKQE
jgi:non-specific serine/threonine protein kinase/serine/threonine-protein kinase